MRLLLVLAALTATLGAGACANRSGDQTIAAYCADPGRQNQDLCKVHRDVESTRADVRRNRDDIDSVRQVADRADRTAGEALGLAQQANARGQNLSCLTRTLRRTDTGSCENGYVLTSCAQSRYTARAGAPTVLRDIDDTQCRFATRVLEMKVRCCAVGAPAPTEVAADRVITPNPRPTS
jgi:hypothetical protein